MITLTFDDCYLSQKKEAKDVLKKTQLKASFYVITDCLEQGQYPEYMKTDDILDLIRDGHEVSSHTKTHPRLNRISKEKLVEELNSSKERLNALGIDAKTFVYPYGAYNQSVVEEVKNAGYICARSTICGFNTDKTDPYLLKCQPVYRWTPFFLIKHWINKAERENLWLILMFHQLDNTYGFYGATPKMFKKIIQYISDRKIKTVTMSEGLVAAGLS